MNNLFLDGERARTAKNRNSIDIQGNGAIGDVPNFRHCTLTTVNDSETSADADTRLTQPCSSPVLSQGEAA
jgi:hypothetical protein